MYWLQRALEAGVPAAWVTGNSVCGDDRRLRLWREEREQAYVLAVSEKEYVCSGFRQVRVEALLADLPEERWMRLSAGDGAKGPRWYDWLLMGLNRPLPEGCGRWVPVLRKLDGPDELTAFVIFAPTERLFCSKRTKTYAKHHLMPSEMAVISQG